jgi:hypothetical protein
MTVRTYDGFLSIDYFPQNSDLEDESWNHMTWSKMYILISSVDGLRLIYGSEMIV